MKRSAGGRGHTGRRGNILDRKYIKVDEVDEYVRNDYDKRPGNDGKRETSLRVLRLTGEKRRVLPSSVRPENADHAEGK